MPQLDWLRRIPWTLVACALILMGLGLSGIARGDELAHAGEFFSKQAVWIILAVPALLLATLLPYRTLRHHSYAWLFASVMLLGIVYFFPAKWGSRRWIPLGFMNFQPSELAKLAWILALARYLMYRKNCRRVTGLVVPFALTLVPVGLILKEPDLGTSMLFLPVLAAMLFVAGARLKHLALVACLGAAVLPIFWLAMSAEQKSRITALFLQRDGGPAPTGDGYHLHQSKQVLALGGALGSRLTGTTVEDPLAYHLPACRTDFVICMIGERWGLLGTMGALAVYLFVFGRGLIVAASTREPFGKLLAVGIVTLLATQTIVNIGMTVGLAPVTGVTLPFLSYGGSSLLFSSVALGLLMNVAMRPGYEM
ncbi:MAG TPA: FtsW/RodA/SpoVE family cell cycle protein [Planctomycetaceae bacterium]|nr:FtsW/RodA/SpoVE family cell cycle protein [Planctomycetaceae bacterium]